MRNHVAQNINKDVTRKTKIRVRPVVSGQIYSVIDSDSDRFCSIIRSWESREQFFDSVIPPFNEIIKDSREVNDPFCALLLCFCFVLRALCIVLGTLCFTLCFTLYFAFVLYFCASCFVLRAWDFVLCFVLYFVLCFVLCFVLYFFSLCFVRLCFAILLVSVLKTWHFALHCAFALRFLLLSSVPPVVPHSNFPFDTTLNSPGKIT